MTVHAAARIVLWCGWALAVEFVSIRLLIILAVVSATAFAFKRYRQMAARLLFRSRWLMLILLLTYAYTLPGEALWPGWGALSPTLQGIEAGGVRMLRLALMLVALAVLLVSTAREQLIYGLYVLARPLAYLGFDRRAFAVRLGLTLEILETRRAECLSLQQTLGMLKQPVDPADSPAAYRLQAEPWKWHDSLLVMGAGAAVLASTL